MDHRLDEILSKLNPEEREYVLDFVERDPLTNLYNRRRFDFDIKFQISRRLREGDFLSLILFDIDNFGRFNKEKGVQEGDNVLRGVAKSLVTGLRDYDLEHISRYGGEEIAVLLPEVSLDNAAKIADRLRHGVREITEVTVSAGVAAFHKSSYKLDPSKLLSLSEIVDEVSKYLISCSDLGLRAAKKSGKNFVGVYSGNDILLYRDYEQGLIGSIKVEKIGK